MAGSSSGADVSNIVIPDSSDDEQDQEGHHSPIILESSSDEGEGTSNSTFTRTKVKGNLEPLYIRKDIEEAERLLNLAEIKSRPCGDGNGEGEASTSNGLGLERYSLSSRVTADDLMRNAEFLRISNVLSCLKKRLSAERIFNVGLPQSAEEREIFDELLIRYSADLLSGASGQEEIEATTNIENSNSTGNISSCLSAANLPPQPQHSGPNDHNSGHRRQDHGPNQSLPSGSFSSQNDAWIDKVIDMVLSMSSKYKSASSTERQSIIESVNKEISILVHQQEITEICTIKFIKIFSQLSHIMLSLPTSEIESKSQSPQVRLECLEQSPFCQRDYLDKIKYIMVIQL